MWTSIMCSKQSGNMLRDRLLCSQMNVKSFLSSSVGELLHKSRSEDFEDILTPEGFLDWNAIGTILKLTGYSRNALCYKDIIMKLAPCITHIFLVYHKMPLQKFWEKYRSYFNWTKNEELFHCAFVLLRDVKYESSTVLATLLLTAAVERALGNVYLLKAKNVPYLLKDLLSTDELEEIFGPTEMAVINIFLGSPSSLNLRNILWHGFVSPTEIDQRYGYFLIVLTMSLGLNLQKTGLQDLPYRPYVTFHKTDVLNGTFPDIGDEECRHLHCIFENTYLVYPLSRPYWKCLLLKFKEKRYGEALVLLIPQLENCLRVIFAAVNNRPQHVLTAEPTSRYVTFTEMFSNLLDDGSPNLFNTVVTENEMELLLDVFVHPEGPRVRDRLSHGEVDLCNIPQHLVKHLLCIAAVFCLKFMVNEEQIQKVEFVTQLKRKSSSYKSFYHPTAMLREKIAFFILSLKKWDSCPIYVPEVLEQNEGHCIEPFRSCISLLHTLYEVPSSSSFRSLPYSDGLEEYGLLLNNHRMLTVCRPKIEIEVATILRKISHHSAKISENVEYALTTFHTSWKTKALRSRQRVTYSRLLKSVHTLYASLCLILTILIAHFLHINELSLWATEKRNAILKILKLALKYVENLDVMTGAKANKWEESVLCTFQFVPKVHDYLKILERQKFPS